jgi:hypothetical protein
MLLYYLLAIIIIIGGLRYEIGADWFSYNRIFNNSGENIEIGFAIFINIVKFVYSSYLLFIFLVFLISFLIKTLIFKKLSYSFYISLLLYFGLWFFVYDINGIRQGLAIGLIAVSTYYAYKRMLLHYLLWLFAAISIHQSAIVFVPFYLLVGCNIKKIPMLIMLLLIIFLQASGRINNMMNNIIVYFIGKSFNEKFISYSLNKLYNENILLSFTSFHRIFIFFIVLFFTERMYDTRMKNMYRNAAFLSIIIYFLFCNVEIIATRLSLYYRFMECFSLTSFSTLYHKRKNKIIIGLCFYLYILIQVNQNLAIGIDTLIPYKTILSLR